MEEQEKNNIFQSIRLSLLDLARQTEHASSTDEATTNYSALTASSQQEWKA